MSRRSLLVTIGALLALALLVLGGVWLHFAESPPDVGPGQHRFTVQESGTGANDPGERIEVRGQAVYVRVLDVVQGGQGGAVARIGVQVPQQSGAPLTGGGRVHAGDSFDVGSVEVLVDKVWSMPSRSHSAVDLELTELP